MQRIAAGDIVKAVKGKLLQGDPGTTVDGVSTDTRTLEPGSLFIPLKGERFDGHQFIEEAVKKGAKAVLASREVQLQFEEIAVIMVDDTLEGLHRLAKWYRSLFDVDVVAVTGSTGKTTTKNMIASVLGRQFPALKTRGNYNNQIGLPLTVMQLEERHRVAVVEMGMSGFGEIKSLMDIARPRVSVITNIGTSHIEKLGSRENILRAKMEIFDGMGENPVGVINADDPLLLDGVRNLHIPVASFGIKQGDYRAVDIKSLGEKGSEYTLQAEGKSYRVEVPLPGRHNVYNSLASIAVGRIFGIDFHEIVEGLKSIENEKMRLNIFFAPGGVKVINDAYNASPDSMKSALEVLAEVAKGRKIAVLGDMLEMGSFAEEGHRLVGKHAASNNVDILITVGQDSRFIALGAQEAGMDPQSIYYFENKEEAGDLLDNLVKENDTVLFKGSRGMKMEELVKRIQERR